MRISEQTEVLDWARGSVRTTRGTVRCETIVVALAAAAGVVIENARLYAEASRRERWLAATAEITALLGDPEERQRLGSSAQRHYYESGTVPSLADHYRQVIDETIGRSH